MPYSLTLKVKHKLKKSKNTALRNIDLFLAERDEMCYLGYYIMRNPMIHTSNLILLGIEILEVYDGLDK